MKPETRSEQERYAGLLREMHRRQAHDSLLDYATWIRPDYRIGHHHRAIAAKLEAVERGEIDRLFITAPPRHGKSLQASVIFPAWFLGRHPQKQIIAAAYGGELISGFGARLRNLAGSEEHREVFGDRAALAPDVRARDMWLTKAGGVYRAAGVGAGITGFGAHLLLIDDPVKSREDADSPTMREKVWEWWQNDAYTRLMKGGAVVVIMTRWHEDDLGGRIMEQEGDQWEIVHFPAIDEAGQALWAEEYPLDALERIRTSVGPRAWQALYQGSPTPDEGAFFKAEWFQESPKRYTPRDAEKGIIRTYGASDYAVVTGSGDFTVHAIVGVDSDDNVHVLDVWRKQAGPDEWTEAMLDLIERWKPISWAEEKGGIQRAAEPYIVKRGNERKIYFSRVQFASVQDKPTRAVSFQGRMASMKVFWPYKAPWFADVQAEMLTFPSGKNDDAVDTFSLIGRMLAGMAIGKVQTVGKERPGIFSLSPDKENLPPGTRALTWQEIIDSSMKWRKRRRRGR